MLKKLFLILLCAGMLSHEVRAQRPDDGAAAFAGISSASVVVGLLLPGTKGVVTSHGVKYTLIETKLPTQATVCMAGPVDYPYNGSLVIPHALSVSGTNYYVTDMKPACFQQTDVKSVSFNDLIRTIPTNAFLYCAELTDVKFHGNVKFLEGGAFMGCIKLNGIYLPELMKYIGGHAFDGCVSLTSINIPVACSYMGEYAFYACSNLEKVKFDGNGPEYLPENCFDFCGKLKEITLPDGVRYICNGAFRTSGIERITWGKDVKGIGIDAFYSTPLKAIYSHTPVPPDVGSGGGFTHRMCAEIELHVPRGCGDAYRKDAFWSNFRNIIADL